ncbi:hypothetical protein GJAV_G00257400 [Gymnothorax javanicus]|nr:hypothetical protein GJAV_G00257400 [Gymnothorax javanicus]
MINSEANRFVGANPMYPQQSAAAPPAFHTVHNVYPVLGKFLKGEPKALGVVQIMIGVMGMLYGIVFAIYPTSIGVYCGIVFWGSLIHIAAGSLGVAAENKLNRCLVNGALVMNIFSAITAGVSIILFTLDLIFRLDRYARYIREDHWSDHVLHVSETRVAGMAGVMLVFSILEFIISICVSAFACRAVCDCNSQQEVYRAPMSHI